jgi:hypothetical protein
MGKIIIKNVWDLREKKAFPVLPPYNCLVNALLLNVRGTLREKIDDMIT